MNRQMVEVYCPFKLRVRLFLFNFFQRILQYKLSYALH